MSFEDSVPLTGKKESQGTIAALIVSPCSGHDSEEMKDFFRLLVLPRLTIAALVQAVKDYEAVAATPQTCCQKFLRLGLRRQLEMLPRMIKYDFILDD